MNGSFPDALQGEPLATDANRIEAMLAELWREQGRDSETGVVRAALWNVIVFTRDEAERRRATEIVAKVSAAVPQRSILISARMSGSDELETWISANCHLVGKGRQMCSEQISIAAGGARVSHVASLVRALLLPDMPVALWWIGDPPGKRDVLDVVRACDLLIFDSRTFSRAEELDRASAMVAAAAAGGDDLQWRRFEEWRLTTAAAFDCSGIRERRNDIRSIRIRYASSAEPHWGESAGAWLFAGWVTAQLRLAVAAGEVALRVEPESADGGGRLMHVRFEFRDGAEISVERQEGAVRAVPRGIKGAAPAVVRLFSPATDHLVRRALRHPQRDLVYERAVAAAARLAKRIG